MNAHEFINYELEFDFNKFQIPIKEEIIGVLDERNGATVNEPNIETDNVQIGDVLVNKVRLKDVESVLMTFKQFLEQNPIDATPLIQSNQTLQKE